MAKLSLYQYESCYYCRKVRAALAELGLEIEVRDIHRDRRWLTELVEARGRRTVPVLRIETDEGVEWMPESEDIIQFLYHLAGREAPSRGWFGFAWLVFFAAVGEAFTHMLG